MKAKITGGSCNVFDKIQKWKKSFCRFLELFLFSAEAAGKKKDATNVGGGSRDTRIGVVAASRVETKKQTNSMISGSELEAKGEWRKDKLPLLGGTVS